MKIDRSIKFNHVNRSDSKIKHSLSKNKIIHLGNKHLSACLLLDKNALGGLWTEKQWENELSSPYRSCLGILKEDRLIALSSGWIIKDHLDIMTVAVEAKYRRLGLGKSIIISLLREAKSLGAKSASLEVNENNRIAILFYINLGFKKVAHRKKYYKDQSGADILSILL